MLKSYIIFIYLVMYSFLIHAQNIIPNGSFETFTACPSGINSGAPDEVAKAAGWYRIKQTPDYFNSCASGTIVNTPNNFFGYQNPASGNAYMGLWGYQSTTANFREVIAAKLTSTLNIGQKYFLKLTISNAEGYNSNCGIDKIGLRFSTVKHILTSPPPINNFAHLYFNSIMADTINWKYVFTSFVADSNYQYIEIGNFFTDLNTNVQILKPSTGYWSYYYIDDVALTTDSLEALTFNATSTSIIDNPINSFLSISPNPTSGIITLQNTNNIELNYLAVYSTLGHEVYFSKSITEVGINLSFLNEGIYHLKIYTSDGIITKKIVIQK